MLSAEMPCHAVTKPGSSTTFCPSAWPMWEDLDQWRCVLSCVMLPKKCLAVSFSIKHAHHFFEKITGFPNVDSATFLGAQVKMNGFVMNPSWLYCTCCLPPLPVNGAFVRMCKRGALQFVFLKPIIAVITVVLYTQNKYTEGYWGPNNG